MPDRPTRLLRQRYHPAVVCVAIGAVVVTAGLGARYSGVASGGRDPSLGLYRWPAEALVALGSPVAVVLETVALFGFLVRRRWIRAAVLAALAPPVATALTEVVLKPIVDRTRGGSLAYPSGHTTGIFAVAMVVVVLMAASVWLSPTVRAGVAAAAIGVAMAVAAASVAVGDHFATDTVGGACVAIATVLVLGVIVDAVADRRARDRGG
ncbi:phosphatase PAP2 family protein [Actinocatenispora rupis]|uniref:Phosphatidic acid phosphatase type 2/haloperoxidase domain-containing protein n=1 Tax=Actinocatenispora rupis TaxID=519421 RepID=A0A8J3NCM1_9ACTN|nr:phosphatase PAP2 family protein [Actinocatenispora rupis]GID11932.1 hypothetical protein Aru02nite_28210 [Actinocatenispora rupis]